MRWSRAVHHLEELATICADMAGRPATIFPLRVTQLWAFGDVLDSQDDLEWLQVALVVDLPVDEVAWFCHPAGSEHWSNATRLTKNPVVALWRSQRAPVWNHHIRRPLLIWDEADEVDGHGVASEALSALREGTTDPLRLAEPAPSELHVRLQNELANSHQALMSATAAYEARRFSPGKLEPVADALWRASQGYLDVLAATR